MGLTVFVCSEVRYNASRFCSDFCKVNGVTKPERFALLCAGDCIDPVGSAKLVSKFDLLKSYWQVPLSKTAIDIVVSVTPTGQYLYNVRPFGLHSAPPTWLIG